MRPLFKISITESPKNIPANPCGFIRDNNKGPLNTKQMCKVSLKYIGPNG